MNAHLKFYKHAMQNLLFVAPIVFPRIEKMLTFWSLHLNFDKIKKRKKQLLFQKRDFSHFCLKSARKNTLLDALLDKEEAKNSLKRIVVVGIIVVLKRVANLAQNETQLVMYGRMNL